MANDGAGSLIEVLKENQILDPAQLKELNDAHDTDAETLARCLIELGWVTLYQLEMLIANKPQELRIGNYLVLEKAGVGNLGPAYKVRKPGKPGIFILKYVNKDKFAESDQLPRFNQDVRLAAQMQHAHIAPVVTVGQYNNQYLFVREYVDGKDLADQVRDSGPLPIPRACTYIRQAALALQHAHEKGLIHRRIKPANLVALKEAEGNGQGPSIKVVDFGLANIRPRTRDDRGDRDGDLRALGRTFCYLLTGRAPAPPDTSWQNPPGGGPLSSLRPGIPLPVQSIVVNLLGAGSATGMRSMADVAAALEPYAREPVEPPAPPPAANGVANAVASAAPMPVEPTPVDLPFATAAVAAVPVTAAVGSGIADEPAVAEIPFAMAVTQAVVFQPAAELVELATTPDPMPSASAATLAAAAEPQSPVEPASATPVEGVAVAVSGWASSLSEPEPTAPAPAGAAAEPEAPVQHVEPVDIPMASAVTAAIPSAFATEPEVAAPPATLEAPPMSSPITGTTSEPSSPPAPEISITPSEPVLDAVSPAPPPEAVAKPEGAPTPPVDAPPAAPLHEPTPGFPWNAPETVPAVEPIASRPAPAEPPMGAAETGLQNTLTGSPFTGESTAFADAPAEEAGTFPIDAGTAAPRRKGRKKLSKGSIIGLIIGGLLHLVFIVGIILWAMGVFNAQTEPPSKARTSPRAATRAKTPGPTLPMELPRKKENKKEDDLDPFKDVKD